MALKGGEYIICKQQKKIVSRVCQGESRHESKGNISPKGKEGGGIGGKGMREWMGRDWVHVMLNQDFGEFGFLDGCGCRARTVEVEVLPSSHSMGIGVIKL